MIRNPFFYEILAQISINYNCFNINLVEYEKYLWSIYEEKSDR